MIWPGTGDPYKRKKAIRFLLISAAVGGIAVLLVSVGVNPIKMTTMLPKFKFLRG